MIKGQEGLRKAYQDETVAREYVELRCVQPLGAMLHARQTRVLQDLIRQQRFNRVAEVAPGPARVTVDIVPLLPNVTIIDASIQMLAEARNRLAERGYADRVRPVQADAFKLPVKAQFDLVYSFRLIRHFQRDDRLKLYQQIHSILAPGGYLVFDAVNEVVSAPLRAVGTSKEYAHFDALVTPEEIRSELRESGFEVSALTGVQHRYPTLLKCQTLVAPRSAWMARAAMEVIDRSGGEPLEWVVVCRRA